MPHVDSTTIDLIAHLNGHGPEAASHTFSAVQPLPPWLVIGR
jgi:hypothetical protein